MWRRIGYGAPVVGPHWIRVGRTQGRGKKERYSEYGKPVKEVYLYPLQKDLREEARKAHRHRVLQTERGPDHQVRTPRIFPG